MGIRRRMYLLLLVVFIPLILLEAFIYSNWFEIRKRTEMQANLELARAVAKSFEAFLDGLVRNELSVGLALTASRPMSSSEGDRVLDTIRMDNPAVHTIFLLSPTGKVLASSLKPFVGFDLKERSFYRRIIEGQNWAVSELIIGRLTGKPIFTVSRAVRNEAGELVGIVAAAVDPERLDHVLGFDRTKEAAVSLLDNQGMRVYRYPWAGYTWEERNWLNRHSAVGESLKGREMMTSVVSKRTGEVRLIALAPINSIGWVATSSRAEHEVMAAIMRILLPTGVITMLVTLAAFVAAIAVSRPITASIRRLRDHAVATGRGRVASVDLPSGPGELKDLADAFNQMTDKVRSREDALREARDELELRVAERTEELRAAYDRLVDETREREKLEERLRQSQKMEAVGTLAGGIAHDFNNMLSVIIGNAELALDDLGQDKETTRSIEQIIKAAKRARDLVKQILTFSRKTEIGRNAIRLTPLVTETYKLLRGTLPSTIRMDLGVEK